MRKLSYKWPIRISIISFLSPIFYVFFRIGKPGIFSFTEFAEKTFGGAFILIMVWVIYGIACLFACGRTVVIKGQKVLKNCENCKFSEEPSKIPMDAMADSEKVKCNLTGYNYINTYICKKWEPK